MIAYINTQCGQNKSSSEDRVLIQDEIVLEQRKAKSFTHGIVAVADGVGGNNAGAVAAYQVCKGLMEVPEPTNEDFVRINEELIEKSKENENLRDMATTASGLVFAQSGRCSGFHVGNTRIYAIQAGQYLKQLTVDDTVVNYLVRTGKLSEEEAINYPAKNEITACFGGGKIALLKIKTFNVDIEDTPLFLLTCDGIHDTLSLDDMEDIICEADGNWQQAVDALVVSAKESGSTDDCSAVIIDCNADDLCETINEEKVEEIKPEILDKAQSEENTNDDKNTDNNPKKAFFGLFHPSKKTE